jgi:superfamily I DNA/RNA helicase
VLYPRNDRGRINALCQALRRTSEVSWISNESDPGGGVRSLAQPGVRLATIHAVKGLEFTAVILCALDLLPNRQQVDEVRDGNLLYVGLTRATDELIVTWAGRSDFTDRLPRASKAVPWTEALS